MIYLSFKQKLFQAISELYTFTLHESDIQLQKTRKEFEGDITLVVFPLLKISKKNPEQTAQEIGEYLSNNIQECKSFNVVKGFLNITLQDAFFLKQFEQIILNEKYGMQPTSSEMVMVEYASPNTNKPLHLGHVRNILLGFSISKIMESCGKQVIKTQIINDRGVHICKSMLAWKKWGNGETPDSSGMKGDHLVGKYYVLFGHKNQEQINELTNQGLPKEQVENNTPLMKEVRDMLLKWEQGDKEIIQLWETMNSWVYHGFNKTYDRLGVNFDKNYYESDTYIYGKHIVEEGLQKGVFYKKTDGSVWCDLTHEGLDEKLLLRADGTSVYITQDLGTAVQRFNDYNHVSAQIYTVGNEQDYHFKVLFLLLQKLGYDWAKKNHHLSYGMMELPSGKMKTREGTVVDADDLMNEMYQTAKLKTQELGKLDDIPENQKEELYWSIGLAALKYFILKVDPKKKMLFNPEESIDFNGHTGPFIQYTYARCSAIKRKSKDILGNEMYSLPKNLLLEEKNLLKILLELPEKIEESAENYNPSILANYLYDVAKTYNYFYQSTPILREEDKNKQHLRICLSTKTAQVLKYGLNLLGIEAPERM